MNETLKTIRLIHQILIIASAALLAFALSPYNATHYRSAISELTLLKRLEIKGYVEFAGNVAQDDVMKDDAEAWKTLIVRSSKMSPSANFKMHPSFYAERPVGDATMEDYRRFFEEKNRIEYVYAGANGDISEIEKTFSIIPTQSISSVSDIWFKLPQEIPRVGVNPLDRNDLAIANPISPETIIKYEVWVSREGEVGSSMYPGEVDTIAWKRIDDTYGMQWLRLQSEIYSGLVQTRGEYEVLFPGVKEYWNYVSTMTPTQALQFLQEKSDSSQKALTFLGLAVPKLITVWAGPLILSMITLFFISHVKHLNREAGGNVSFIKTFPWIALFPDSLSRVLTIFSIAIFPIISSGAVVWASANESGTASILGACITVLNFAASIACLLEIGRLRIELMNEKHIPGRDKH